MENSGDVIVAQELVLCVRSNGSRCSNVVERAGDLCLSCIERAQRSIFSHVRRHLDEVFLASKAATHLRHLIAAVAGVTRKQQLDFLVKRLRRHIVDLSITLQVKIAGRTFSQNVQRSIRRWLLMFNRFEQKLHRVGRRFLGYESEVPFVSPV